MLDLLGGASLAEPERLPLQPPVERNPRCLHQSRSGKLLGLFALEDAGQDVGREVADAQQIRCMLPAVAEARGEFVEC